MSDVVHGGALRAAMRAWPHAPTPWLDLSTGLNPLAYPVGDLPSEVWTRLPEREDAADVETIAARAYNVPAAADVVAAPGVQSLIQILPSLFPAKRVAVLGPTYEEHASRWRAAGARVRVVERVSDVGGADTIVVVNPNNPDGRCLTPTTLARLATSAGRREGRLIVDESFADMLPPDASCASVVGDSRTLVLRSFGKAFGLGGVRLGFAIGDRPDIAAIRDALGPWAVSGPALAIGRRALADTAWLDASRTRLRRDSLRLDAMLTRAALDVIGGTPLFRLARHPQANALHDRLCACGILTRRFADRPDLLRFGLPSEDQAWDRLELALIAARREVADVTLPERADPL